jgi:hypothetical protein
MQSLLPGLAKGSVLFIIVLTCSCSKKTESEQKTTGQDTAAAATASNQSTVEEFSYVDVSYDEMRTRLPAFDLKQDLAGKTLEELHLLKNTIPARYGFLFMNASLRDYFNNTPWYKGLMEARWYGDCAESGIKPAPPIEYTAEEQAFLDDVEQRIEARLKENYITRNGLRYANVKNIVNAWQFNQLPAALLGALDRNGFAIVPNNNVQLFHLYEQNDYSQTQNFVSTDLYLQLFHMHFSFMLRGLEEDHFVPLLRDLLSGLEDEAHKTGGDAAQYTFAFFAIPHTIMGNKVAVPPAYQKAVAAELRAIEAGGAAPSALLPAYETFEFQYDIFKPRGHYTRNDTLKQYFKAMQWLQTAPWCLDDETDLKRAITAAHILNKGKSHTGKSLKSLYRAILEPTSFLVGQPDNISLLDVCNVIENRGNDLENLLSATNLAAIRAELAAIEATKNVIKPKIQNTCPSKINFMPSRFVLDNEILQEMTDVKERPYPKGLDVMAAFGSKPAQDILVSEYPENKAWSKFLPQLEKMKAKYKNYEAWDESVYAKWIKSLNVMLEPDKQYPSFMQLPAWNKKNLNTALASWAELKHDAVLYTEQPMAAECGDGGECPPPPEPYVVGYVEPNVRYWKEALDLLKITEELLKAHDLLDDHTSMLQYQLRELCTFLLTVSEKELRHEKLTEQEYNTIELIGTSVENITHTILGIYRWEEASGPDREVAVVADVYTNNSEVKAGILHAAVGYANDLYVIVEIEGLLYLAKGATFSYYEFPRPLDSRMTDEEWQEMLKKGKAYPLEPWMKDVIIILDKNAMPESKEYIYSSGC